MVIFEENTEAALPLKHMTVEWVLLGIQTAAIIFFAGGSFVRINDLLKDTGRLSSIITANATREEMRFRAIVVVLNELANPAPSKERIQGILDSLISTSDRVST